MEADLSTCRKCNQVKIRILSGKFDQRNKKYVDENGKLWNGRVCSDCNRERVREHMKVSRLAKKDAAQLEQQVQLSELQQGTPTQN